MATPQESTVVRLENVRISFPALDAPKPVSAESTKVAYQARFLFPPTFDFAKVTAAVKAAILNKAGRMLDTKTFVRPVFNDAGLKDDTLAGWRYINAKNELQIPVVGPNKVAIPVEKIAQIVYPGCWVNAVVEPWLQVNKHGKAINWNLKAVQFVKDGDRFGGARSKPSDPDVVFEALELPQGGDVAGLGGDDGFNPF